MDYESNHLGLVSRNTLCLGYNQLRKLTGLLTGHCRVGKHMHRIDLKEHGFCRYAFVYHVEEETSIHILRKCKASY